MRVLAILLLAALVFAVVHAVSEDDLLLRAQDLYREILALRSTGMDVSDLVSELGHALSAWSNGEISDEEFSDRLDSIEHKIQQLRSVAAESSAVSMLIKYGLLALTLSAPLMIYFVLPRLCAWAWYVPRRRWVVSDEDR